MTRGATYAIGVKVLNAADRWEYCGKVQGLFLFTNERGHDALLCDNKNVRPI